MEIFAHATEFAGTAPQAGWFERLIDEFKMQLRQRDSGGRLARF
jgi:hypothetical protein